MQTPVQVLSCEFCEISKNTFFTEHLWATASKTMILVVVFQFVDLWNLVYMLCVIYLNGDKSQVLKFITQFL